MSAGEKDFMFRLMSVLLVFFTLTACSSLQAEEEASLDKQSLNPDPNLVEGIYINNHIDHPEKSFFGFWKMRLFGDDVWHDPNAQKHLIPQTEMDNVTIEKPQLRQVTWLGHSTFFIQHNGLNILTDPIFSKRASPFSFVGPKRYTAAPAKLTDLPPIDIVVISHNHYDHLDEESIKALGNQPIYYVPSNLKHWFVEAGIKPERVVALRWWQKAKLSSLNEAAIKPGVITAMPSQHWSARSLSDRNETHWASWLLELDGFTFWFAGDTGYNDKDFVAIGEHIKETGKALDLALIPIGAYAPRWFMKAYHVNTEEAVQIHHDVNALLSLGMHWGTFPLTAEKPMEPYERLNRLRAAGEIKAGTEFKTLKIGETFPISQE